MLYYLKFSSVLQRLHPVFHIIKLISALSYNNLEGEINIRRSVTLPKAETKIPPIPIANFVDLSSLKSQASILLLIL